MWARRGQKTAGESLGQQDPVPRHAFTRFSNFQMHCDEIGERNAIAINKNQILTLRLSGSTIAYGRQPEASVFMPDVLHSTTKMYLPTPDDRRSLRAGAIIGNKDFPVCIRNPPLQLQTVQDGIQRIRSVIGRNDQGELHTSTLGQFRTRTRLLELKKAAQHSTSPLTPTTAYPVTYGPSPASSL